MKLAAVSMNVSVTVGEGGDCRLELSTGLHEVSELPKEGI